MGTIYTGFGLNRTGQTRLDIQKAADKALKVDRTVLGWSYGPTVQYQFVEPDGKLADYVGKAFLFEANLGFIAHKEKYAPSEDVWAELCILFMLFGEQSCLLNSDGTVMAVRQPDKIWLPVRDEPEEGEPWWPDFAEKHMEFDQFERITQDEAQAALIERQLQ